MSELDTIIGSIVQTAIKVNGMLIPANSFAEHIRQFSDPAIFATEGFEPFTMSLGGSMTKVKIRDRYFALLTRHQIDKGGFDYAQLSVLNGETRQMITTERAIFQKFLKEDEIDFDSVVCEFTTPVLEGALSKVGWYSIKDELDRPRTPKPSIVCAVGYPGFRNTIDFDTMHYGISPNAVYGKEASPSLTHRLCFEPMNELKYSPAGMSGSPVFGISLQTDEPSAFLAGFVTEASAKKVHFVSLRNVRRFLMQILDDP